ncbi:hypothetical protein BpHYR1_025265 [Brachionus plicatilis]|uniref:Uncharacterized protein n=1 Tax=Brachionus plicatilis TaxID=10195 RepID=A0A3M7SQB9_BRAPC|nr:hypothetical protein BpHYR1_025265 [Brachionus plicatilis]
MIKKFMEQNSNYSSPNSLSLRSRKVKKGTIVEPAIVDEIVNPITHRNIVTDSESDDGELSFMKAVYRLWSLFDRIKLNLPRTNYHFESWHRQIQLDTRKHLTVPKVVELFRREQNKVDSDKLRIKNGDQFKQKKDKHETNLRILRLVTDYKIENIEAFLEGLGNNLLIDKEKN